MLRRSPLTQLRASCNIMRPIFRRHNSKSTIKAYIRDSITPGGLFETLKSRGLVADAVKPTLLDKLLESEKQTVYLGIDPSAEWLHIGHLLPLMCLLQFHLHGHQVISLIGGATGRIGDPSGRSMEREKAVHHVVDRNVVSLQGAVSTFFERATAYSKKRADPNTKAQQAKTLSVKALNNYDWTKDLTLLDFLETTGRFARMNNMLNKESVKSRLESDNGMSFAEFTYQLLQGNDFFRLNLDHGCRVQVGGQDQWGNILAGVDIIQRYANAPWVPKQSPKDMKPQDEQRAYGLTTPLLTGANGGKIGKSSADRKGTIWLNKVVTSTTNFYQHFTRTPDEDVGKFLKMFTLLPLDRIAQVMAEHEARPELRKAQRLLASEVTELVHGEEGLSQAQVATDVVFNTDFTSPDLRADDIIKKLEGNPILVWHDGPDVSHAPIVSLLARHGVMPTPAIARATIMLNGVTCNGVRLKKPNERLNRDILIDRRVAVINAGKNKYLVVALRNELEYVPVNGLRGRERGPPTISKAKQKELERKAERRRALKEERKAAEAHVATLEAVANAESNDREVDEDWEEEPEESHRDRSPPQ